MAIWLHSPQKKKIYMATSQNGSIQRAGTEDVLEIQNMASSFTKLITAVRERDVDTAQKHSVVGLFFLLVIGECVAWCCRIDSRFYQSLTLNGFFCAANQYDPNALKNLDALNKVTEKKTLTLADIGASTSAALSSDTSSALPATSDTTPSSEASKSNCNQEKQQSQKLIKREKTLELIELSLENCTTTLISGWLNKKPRRLGLTKKKWVKLCADPSGKRFMLFYFKRKDELRQSLGGSLPITGLCELKAVDANKFVLTLESNRQVNFIAKTSAERQRWMSSLEECISKGDKNWAIEYLENHSRESLNTAMDVIKNFLRKVLAA